MKIRAIGLRDFRAFPSDYRFDFGDRNLALYGENGCGKSSLFHAFVEFFDLHRKATPFAEFRNIFIDPPSTDGHVTVEFSEGLPAVWSFGAPRPSGDTRVQQTALRVGCIDYRALLRTHFVHLDAKVNLFSLIVGDLLGNYPILLPGGRPSTIRESWRQVESSKPRTRHRSNLRVAHSSVSVFNDAVRQELPKLAAKASDLLAIFPNCKKMVLQFDFPGLLCDEGLKEFIRKEINLQVSFDGKILTGHHFLMNEERLSAIALALYFAGLLVSIPAPLPNAPQFPKILVLDDVLIGLDMSNRIPVLDLLEQLFADWQILLMTHDKVWNEIVRLRTQGKSWHYDELYVGEAQGGGEVPIHKPDGKGWGDYLARARDHLALSDERAAAVYARAAFESKIMRYCEKKKAKVEYHSDPRRIGAQVFWDALKKVVNEELSKTPTTDTKRPALIAIQAGFAGIEVYRKIVLNPLSHSAAASIARAEIQGAIDAIDNFGKLLDG